MNSDFGSDIFDDGQAASPADAKTTEPAPAPAPNSPPDRPERTANVGSRADDSGDRDSGDRDSDGRDSGGHDTGDASAEDRPRRRKRSRSRRRPADADLDSRDESRDDLRDDAPGVSNRETSGDAATDSMPTDGPPQATAPGDAENAELSTSDPREDDAASRPEDERRERKRGRRSRGGEGRNKEPQREDHRREDHRREDHRREDHHREDRQREDRQREDRQREDRQRGRGKERTPSSRRQHEDQRPAHDQSGLPNRQRIAIFLDAGELQATSADKEISFGHLRRHLAHGRVPIRAIAYHSSKQKALGKSLAHAGFEATSVDSKSATNIAIAVDAMALADRLDCVILVPGSNALAHLAKTLRARGVRVESANFEAEGEPKLGAQGHLTVGDESSFAV